MAEYGAEVIKIDTMDPLFGPRIFCWFPMEASPGKRHLLLNLKEDVSRYANVDEGCQVLWVPDKPFRQDPFSPSHDCARGQTAGRLARTRGFDARVWAG